MIRNNFVAALILLLFVLPTSSSAEIFIFNQSTDKMKKCLTEKINQEQVDYVRGSAQMILPGEAEHQQVMKRIINIMAYNSSACKIAFFDLISNNERFEAVVRPVFTDLLCRYLFDIIPESGQKECLADGYPSQK